MIEDIEEFLDPGLDPILLKSAYRTEGGIMQIRIGDQVYDYDEKYFRFYMTTKMPNPHYLPEIFIKMTIINSMYLTSQSPLWDLKSSSWEMWLSRKSQRLRKKEITSL